MIASEPTGEVVGKAKFGYKFSLVFPLQLLSTPLFITFFLHPIFTYLPKLSPNLLSPPLRFITQASSPLSFSPSVLRSACSFHHQLEDPLTMTTSARLPVLVSADSCHGSGSLHGASRAKQKRPVPCNPAAEHGGVVDTKGTKSSGDGTVDQAAELGNPAPETSVTLPADGRRPRDWDMLRFSSLKSLVAEAKGGASKKVLTFIET
jgi:hypothetical protein